MIVSKVPQDVTGTEVIGNVVSLSSETSYSVGKQDRTRSFKPHRTNTIKRLCKADDAIEVSDSDEDERTNQVTDDSDTK